MNHDNIVGTAFECVFVAGLLIAAVAVVLIVFDDCQAQFASQLGSAIGAAVIDQNYFIHDIDWNVSQSLTQRLRGVVCRHDNDDSTFQTRYRVDFVEDAFQ